MMTLTNTACICVDVQYDRLTGPLAVYDGESILRPLTEIARECPLVIASRDWHPADHFTFSEEPEYRDGSWPPHCVQGTKGARLYPSIRKLANFVVSKGMNKNPPDAYSAFVGRTLRPINSLLEILGRSPIETIIVGGLDLDVCVKYTALDANALGYQTIVPLNCSRGRFPGISVDTLVAFENAGVLVTDELGGVSSLA